MPKTTQPPKRRSRAVDPQCRAIRWSGKTRTREARLFRDLRIELVNHVGGHPTAAERALIDRIAMLQTHLARMDERMFETGELSDHASRQYLAWANSVSRMLQALGLKEAVARKATAEDAMRELRDRYGVGEAEDGE
jgi:hypothetical protein